MDNQTFEEILTPVRTQNANVYIVPEGWTQGRTIFGGVIAALAHETMRPHVPIDRPLKALQICLMSPNPPGEVLFAPDVLRSGKSVTTVLTRISSNGQTSALVTGIYGSGRDSQLKIEPAVPRPRQPIEELSDFPNTEGLTPRFLEHFHWRFSLDPQGVTAYLRFKDDETRLVGLTEIVALTDVCPPPALLLLGGTVPASTLTLALEITDTTAFSPDLWWRIEARSETGLQGYSSSTALLINPDNRVAAISRQIAAIFG